MIEITIRFGHLGYSWGQTRMICRWSWLSGWVKVCPAKVCLIFFLSDKVLYNTWLFKGGLPNGWSFEGVMSDESLSGSFLSNETLAWRWSVRRGSIWWVWQDCLAHLWLEKFSLGDLGPNNGSNPHEWYDLFNYLLWWLWNPGRNIDDFLFPWELHDKVLVPFIWVSHFLKLRIFFVIIIFRNYAIMFLIRMKCHRCTKGWTFLEKYMY